MSVFDQLPALAQSYIWVPGLVFIVIVGGVYWLTRTSPQLVAEPAARDAVTESLDTPKAKEQRGAFRRSGNPIEIFICIPADKATPRIASVLDRSVGGVRLDLFYEVEVGTVFSIRPTKADGMVPWVDVEVKSCRKSEEMPGHFDVGCQYVRSPPYSIQLLFG